MILIIAIIIVFSGCSKDDDDGDDVSTPIVVKKITGQLGGGYSIKTSSTNSSLISVSQIWVIPMSKTDYVAGKSNVSFNYAAMFEDKQVFNIADNGSFELSIKEPCQSNDETTCLGFVLLLVNPQDGEKKNHIKGFLSLDGEHSLIRFPYAEITNDINMGTINVGTGDKSGEGIGENIDQVEDSFTLSLSDLQLIAHTDDYMKLVKNVYINPTRNLLVRYGYVDDKAKYDVFTNFKNATLLGSSFAISNSKDEAEYITDGSKIYSTVPPSGVLMAKYDSNGTKLSSEEFNTTKPFSLDGVNDPNWGHLSTTRFDVGNIYFSGGNYHYYIESTPSGFWTLKNNNKILGNFDLGLISPINLATKVKTYVPALKFELNSNGDVYKVSIKWYLYNGNNYEEVKDLRNLWENISRYTLTVKDTYSLAPGVLEYILPNPVNPNDLNQQNTKIQYGFYASEIEIKYLVQ